MRVAARWTLALGWIGAAACALPLGGESGEVVAAADGSASAALGDASLAQDGLPEGDGAAEASEAPEAGDDAGGDASDAGVVVDAAIDAEAGAVTALSFDGTDDFVRVNRQVQDDFTLEAWIKTTTSRTGTRFYDGLAVIYADVSGNQNDFGTSILNGKFSFGGSTANTTIQSTTTVTSGQWFHVAAVRVKNTGSIQVLVNGVSEANATGVGTNTSLNASATIDLGGNTIDARYFKGTMDEVRIWNVARTAAQIQGAMRTRLVGNEPGLVGYWRFDDASGNTAADSSGSNNSGSLGNGAAAQRPTWVASDAF